MKKNQYIEISNRGSGKTEKLAKAILEYTNNNPDSRIFVFSKYRTLLQLLHQPLAGNTKVYFSNKFLENEINRGKGPFDMEFYDDFDVDFLSYLTSKDNIYACTSTPGE